MDPPQSGDRNPQLHRRTTEGAFDARNVQQGESRALAPGSGGSGSVPIGGAGQQQYQSQYAHPPPSSASASPYQSVSVIGMGSAPSGHGQGAGDTTASTSASAAEDKDSALNDAILAKRRARPQKVCRPCRLRKVKCSYEVPCQTCIERGHPELCVYLADAQPPAKRVAVDAPSLGQGRAGSPSRGMSLDSGSALGPGGAWTGPSRGEWEAMQTRMESIERMLLEMRQEMRAVAAAGKRVASGGSQGRTGTRGSSEADEEGSVSDSGVTPAMLAKKGHSDDAVYLGGNSVPAMVTALAHKDNSDVEVQNLLGKSVLPIFGLDNDSATYPFVDLWGLPHGSFQRIQLLCTLLPSADGDCIQIFKLYKDTAHVIFPGIVDIVEFEGQLFDFLRTRASSQLTEGLGPLAVQTVFGKNLHWLGLLFAALASGYQCSELARKEKQMRSQVYVCCAYECLRIVNYYTQTTLEDLQILLVLGNVISNNMNAGTSWSLLGLTIRLAQSIGLHYDAPSSDPSLVQDKRSSVWWQIVWQDSLLSITFDRTSPTTIVAHHQFGKTGQPLSYIDCMRRLCKLGLDIVQERSIPSPAHERLRRLTEMRDQIQHDWSSSMPHLVDQAKCRSMTEMLEFWNLYMHRSFILSELCRPAILAKHKPRDYTEILSTLRASCIENLANTVDAFLGLHNITKFAMQSWAAVHRALSSALLLGILGEPSKSARVQSLITRLSNLMSDVVLSVDPSELSAPLSRSVEALGRLATPARSSYTGSTSTSIAPSTTATTPVEPYTAFAAPFLRGAAASEAQSTSSASLQSSPESLMLDEDGSPFSILNTIMWGTEMGGTGVRQG